MNNTKNGPFDLAASADTPLQGQVYHSKLGGNKTRSGSGNAMRKSIENISAIRDNVNLRENRSFDANDSGFSDPYSKMMSST